MRTCHGPEDIVELPKGGAMGEMTQASLLLYLARDNKERVREREREILSPMISRGHSRHNTRKATPCIRASDMNISLISLLSLLQEAWLVRFFKMTKREERRVSKAVKGRRRLHVLSIMWEKVKHQTRCQTMKHFATTGSGGCIQRHATWCVFLHTILTRFQSTTPSHACLHICSSNRVIGRSKIKDRYAIGFSLYKEMDIFSRDVFDFILQTERNNRSSPLKHSHFNNLQRKMSIEIGWGSTFGTS